jgi:uncharacterized membrane protein YfcA
MEIFIIVLAITAVLYSAVGHGGASGYLALMAIFGFDVVFMKSTALTLNLFVSLISFYSFYRFGVFKAKILLPFIIGSMPMAYLGASLNIDPSLYKIILGVFLLIAVARMLFYKNVEDSKIKKVKFFYALVIGMFLGFFSGMIGIGGGIILSPVLLLLSWSNIKETAAISAAFIFLNSASGIAGMLYQGTYNPSPELLFMVLAGVAGGLIGGYFGSKKMSMRALNYFLAAVLLFASVKLIVL